MKIQWSLEVYNEIPTHPFFSVLLALGGCSESADNNKKDSPSEEKENISKEEFKFRSESEYQVNMGNLAQRDEATDPKNNSPDLFKKKIGTAVGAKITIPHFFIWNLDDSEWVKGGKLYVFNDHSAGSEFTISCALSPQQGDKFMKTRARREVDITGTIDSFSSEFGIKIAPCEITRDETDNSNATIKKPSDKSDIGGNSSGESDGNRGEDNSGGFDTLKDPKN